MSRIGYKQARRSNLAQQSSTGAGWDGTAPNAFVCFVRNVFTFSIGNSSMMSSSDGPDRSGHTRARAGQRWPQSASRETKG